MAVVKTAIFAFLVYSVAFQHSDACTPVDCQLSSWSQWSACTTSCGVSGTQSSRRHKIISQRCGGTCTSSLRKTRTCPKLSCLNGGTLHNKTCFCENGYSGICCEKGSTPLDCQLSSWSEWSACPIPACGVSGTQSSSRHEIITGDQGSNCTLATFRKTRACPKLSCLQDDETSHGENQSGIKITIGVSVGGGFGFVIFLMCCCYCCSKCCG